MSGGTGPPMATNRVGKEAQPRSFDSAATMTDSTRYRSRLPIIPQTPPRPSQLATQLSPSPYGNSAAKLLETKSLASSLSSGGNHTTTRQTISTYRQSSIGISPHATPSHLPISPPYTSGFHRQTSFYSPSVFRIPNAPPSTPDSDSNSESDVFNPFSKAPLRGTTHDPEVEGREEPLYRYPSSYEQTLLPSGLCLASPFGSPVASPRIAPSGLERGVQLHATKQGQQGGHLPDNKGDWMFDESDGNNEAQGKGYLPDIKGAWMFDEGYEQDADDEDSSEDANPSTGVSPSTTTTTTQPAALRNDGQDEDYCQVFAKTMTFDPFSVDEYAPRLPSVGPSIKLPAPGPVPATEEKDALVDGISGVGDSARRQSGLEEEVLREGKAQLEGGAAAQQLFCGSSRYLLVGGLDPQCDQTRLRECIEAKVELDSLIGKYLDPHGLAIIIFHDHRAAGFVHQAIQCGALQLADKQEQVYVKFLQADEVHGILGNIIRPCLNSNEAKVCITFDSSATLIFPPIEQLKRTLSTFGDLQEFRPVGTSDNAFLAVFCDSRNGPIAVTRLNKKFIGNAQLRLTLTCPLPDEDSTLPSLIEREDRHAKEINDARDLARHLARVNASSGFETDVFKTQTWIGIPSPHSQGPAGESGPRRDPLRAPFHIHTPTKNRSTHDQSTASPTMQSYEWDKTTLLESPFETPTKIGQSGASRGLDDLYGSPVTPQSRKGTKTVEFDLEPKPSTLIEQLNAKFAKLHSCFEDTGSREGIKVDSDDEVKPFRDDKSSAHPMRTSSLPVTPSKFASDGPYGSYGNPKVTSPFGLYSSPSSLRQPYSLHTTPQHVARVGRQARQVEIMKNVPEDMKLNLEVLRTSRDARTSVMIKDIPNKLSRRQLIDCIQEVVPGEVDFVYLRFDFNNQCNVAYAFVNFTSVSALYRFAKARLGQKWNVFSSEKVLQMTYARVQGKEAFIEHFVNSPILLCEEKWRPVLLNERGEIVPFPHSNKTTYGRNRTSRAAAPSGGFFDSPRRFC